MTHFRSMIFIGYCSGATCKAIFNLLLLLEVPDVFSGHPEYVHSVFVTQSDVSDRRNQRC